jgi:flavin reductase (DIM6/NTAB) family NADH-FMN oxidoreductase RutF
MFYDALLGDHGLPHDPMNALVAPRPIGWISTVGADGVRNLAPYSYFNMVAGRPPVVVFSSGYAKDSQRNAEATGEFVCNIATWSLREEVNRSSTALPPHVDEFDFAGIEAAPSRLVKPPRVKRAPAALECRYIQTVPLPAGTEGQLHRFSLVIGLVVGVYIDDAVLRDGLVDVTLIEPLARLGYTDYSATRDIFSMARPAEVQA